MSSHFCAVLVTSSLRVKLRWAHMYLIFAETTLLGMLLFHLKILSIRFVKCFQMVTYLSLWHSTNLFESRF